MRPRPTARVAALLIAAYVVAFLHGRLSHAHKACGLCTAASADDERVLTEAHELQSMIPEGELKMIQCLLRTTDARAALRARLATCLFDAAALSDGGATALPAGRAALPGASGLPTARGDAVAAARAVRLLEAAAPVGLAGEAVAAPIASEVRSARATEEALVSSPVAPGGSADAVLPPAALALASERGEALLSITCVANGLFFAPDPEQPAETKASGVWMACAGEGAGEGGNAGLSTALGEGLFTQEQMAGGRVALRHVRSGRYLQVVAPSRDPAWVARLHALSPTPAEAFELRSFGGHSFLYSPACGCHLNLRRGTILRGHGAKPGQPSAATPAARMALRTHTAAEVRAHYAARAAAAAAMRAPVLASMARIASLGASNERRVISYGLYGSSARYTVGVVRNAELAPAVYPGWKVRVYHDASVPADVLASLARLDCELVDMSSRTKPGGGSMGGGIGGMFWRFLVASDASVDRFIVRDSDSRLNPRERLAVEEWVSSGRKIHSIRDHPNHDRPLNGGMWGGLRGAVPDMDSLVKGWANREAYMGDLDFLNQKVWTREELRSSQLSHDAYSCAKYPGSRPFPTRRPPDFQHVGQVFLGDGSPRLTDITQCMLSVEAPRACRGQPGWTRG